MPRISRARFLVALVLIFPAMTALAADEPQRPGLAPNKDVANAKKIVFISGPPSHGFAQHEHFAGSMLLAGDLNESVPGVVAEVYKHEWPKDPSALNDAAAIVIYSDGGDGHIAIPHLKQLSELMDKGVGLGCIHYAVEMPKGEPGDDWLKWIGGYFETFWSINPEWTAHYTKIPDIEVTRGVHPFTTHDEWYYHMRFRPDMEGVTPVLAAVPPDNTRQGRDDAHGGNPTVRAGVGKNIPEVTVWIATRDHDGRGFGCTGGHHHWNWAQNDFRKTILNSIVWIAHVEVPKDGVPSNTPTVENLLANLDPKGVPMDFSNEKEQKRIDEMNKPEGGAEK